MVIGEEAVIKVRRYVRTHRLWPPRGPEWAVPNIHFRIWMPFLYVRTSRRRLWLSLGPNGIRGGLEKVEKGAR